MSDAISESERLQIAETSRLSEAVRTLANAYERQDGKLDRIAFSSVRNSAQLDALNKKADTSATKIDGLTAKLGECPCPAVTALQQEVGDLKETTAREAGKIAGAIGVVVTALNLVAPYLFGRS